MRLVIALLLILSALGLSLIALTSMRSKAPAATPASKPTRAVLIATTAATAGNPLADADVAVKQVAEAKAPADAVSGSLSTSPLFKEALLRQDVTAGHVLRSSDLLFARNRGYLASSLLPGTRAVTVAVDAVTGVAGLVSPGDRVDLNLVQSAADANGAGQSVVAEHILYNVPVLAVDQSLERASRASKTSSPPKTVTLQVAPQEALRLTVAQQLGRITLNVRPPEPTAPTEIARAAPLYGRQVANGTLAREVRARAVSTARPARTMTIIEGGDIRSVALP